MKPKKVRLGSVAEYIAAAAPEARKKLREMRACVRAAAPGAEEGLKYGMPAYSYGRILVIFGAFNEHIGFYPTALAVKAFERDLKKFAMTRGTIQFPLDKPLPLGLVRKIIKFRVRENLEKDKKWKTSKGKN